MTCISVCLYEKPVFWTGHQRELERESVHQQESTSHHPTEAQIQKGRGIGALKSLGYRTGIQAKWLEQPNLGKIPNAQQGKDQ
jgi:hypothetical protein